MDKQRDPYDCDHFAWQLFTPCLLGPVHQAAMAIFNLTRACSRGKSGCTPWSLVPWGTPHLCCMVLFLSQKHNALGVMSRMCCLPQTELTGPPTIRILLRKFINNFNCQIWICSCLLNEGNFCFQKHLLMEQILDWVSSVRWISRSQNVFILILLNTTLFNL